MPGGVKVTYRVEGGRQLRKSLKDVEGGLDDLSAIHRAVAGIVSDYARPRAPRSQTDHSGRLAGTIRPGSTRTMAVVRAGYARVPYAGVQEWGWPLRHVPPNPYLVPSAHITEPTWFAKYTERVEALLSKVKGA